MMMVKAESVQERGLMSAGMSGTAAAHGEAVESVNTEKKARRRPDDGTEFCGVRRTRSGKYGAQIWDRSRRASVWLGTFGTADEAAGAFDAAAVELRGAAAKTNFRSPAAVRSSASVTVVKEETAQEQGLSAVNGETAEEHGDGVEAAARRKKRALPDAQNKVEIVHKYYYKRRKDSQAGRDEGRTNHFFQPPEALHSLAGAASPVATSLGVPGVVGASAVWPLAEPPSVGAMAGMATPVVGSNLGFATSKSNTENHANEEVAGTGSGEMMRLLEGLMKQEVQRQGAMMQQHFLEAIEKREQDRMIREEEMARLAREQEILAQERAVAATRDAAVLSFIQKITGQSISMPSMPLPPPSSQTHDTPVAYASAAPPAAPQPLNSLAPARLQSQQQQALVVHQSSKDIVTTPAETPRDASGNGGSGGGGGVAAAISSRWAKAEVHALIHLRNNLEMRRKGARGPLWEEIAAGMRQMGYGRSSAGCRKKWWNMTYYFKKVKESNKKRPEESKTCPYFHQFEALYRDKAALGSPSGAALPPPAAERANAALQDRIEAFAVSAPILQTAPQPRTLPPVAKSGVHGVCGVSVGTQMLASNGGSVASNRFVFSDAGGHAADVHPRVATGGAYMWYPAPIADGINPEHVQEIVGLKQAPVAAIRRSAAARSDSRSGYRGVRLFGGRYIAQIRLPGRPTTRLQLGTFDDVEEAARAYDTAALMLYGAKAKTNFEQPPTGPAADDLPELPVRSSIISAPPASGGRVPQGDGLHVGGVSGGTQNMQASMASNRFFFSEQSSMDLLNDSPEPPVRSSTISVGSELVEFLKAFTDMVV